MNRLKLFTQGVITLTLAVEPAVTYPLLKLLVEVGGFDAVGDELLL
jgi:hypothetical protein